MLGGPPQAAAAPAPPQQNPFTFREYLAGIRRPGVSPNNNDQSSNAPPPARTPQRIPHRRQAPPPPPPAPPPKPQPSQSKGAPPETTVKPLQLSQSEKSGKKSDENNNKSGEAATTPSRRQNNNGKSTEKLEESKMTKDAEKDEHRDAPPKLTDKDRECEKMKSFVRSLVKKDAADELDSQFEKLRGYIPKSFTRYLFDENSEKCRFAGSFIFQHFTEVSFPHCYMICLLKIKFESTVN